MQHLIEAGRHAAAANAARALLAKSPGLTEGWLLLALAEQRRQRFSHMLAALREAERLQPANTTVLLKLREAELYCGLGGEARAGLARMAQGAAADVRLLTALANLYTMAGAHGDRLRCARQALALAPGDPALLASAAAAETACGEIAAAEQHLDELLARNPDDHGACYRRSVLRRQQPGRNHVEAMEVQLAKLPADSPGVVPLSYALAKEYEDLGQYVASAQHLQRGAARRRLKLSYQVDTDEHAMREIARAFAEPVAAPQARAGLRGDAAIFVTGLPRSGTTLVDRVLSSHSNVESLGEINDLAYAIMELAAADDLADRQELIQRAAALDPAVLGADYLRRASGYLRAKPRFIDKTPWNFLYFGLIARALPGARIIHVRRDPLDSCLALYKTLFRDGSPYSYDLQDLGRYYLAYHDLMVHWRRVLPGRIVEVEYESLVQSQQAATAGLLAACDLPFEAACLEFHRNTSPAATASAAQVREPLHARSVGNWRNYATTLAPLLATLRAGGLAVG